MKYKFGRLNAVSFNLIGTAETKPVLTFAGSTGDATNFKLLASSLPGSKYVG